MDVEVPVNDCSQRCLAVVAANVWWRVRINGDSRQLSMSGQGLRDSNSN